MKKRCIPRNMRELRQQEKEARGAITVTRFSGYDENLWYHKKNK